MVKCQLQALTDDEFPDLLSIARDAAKQDMLFGEEFPEATHPSLKFSEWIGEKFATVEHIAPQSRGKNWPDELYSDDQYERLGNLTLLPLNANQSLSARPWDQKKKFYGALAARTQEESASIVNQMKADGVGLSEAAGAIYSGHFLPHVHAISRIPGEWGLATVEKRGRELAELAWNRFAPWLGMPG